MDGSRWREVAVWTDGDSDGITLADSNTVCAGETVAGLTAPQGAPFSGFEAHDTDHWDDVGTLPNNPKAWDDEDEAETRGNGEANVRLRPGRCSDYLVVNDFRLDVPADAEVTGVAVHIFGAADLTSDPLFTTSGLHLVGPEGELSENMADPLAPWAEAFTTMSAGGPATAWGVPLTPATVNDESFGVALSVCRGGSGIGSTREVVVDHIWIEAFTDADRPDCDDADPAVYEQTLLRMDSDSDGYTVGAEVAWCVGQERPSGWIGASAGEDCDDDDSRVRPNATAYYSTPRSDGSYDYNCDGSQTPRTENTATGCFCAAACVPVESADVSPEGACGSALLVDRCEGLCPVDCTLNPTSLPIRCR